MRENLSVLIASDNATDAALVKQLLGGAFSSIPTSTVAEKAVEDFDLHKPDILVLAFHTLEKTESYYLGLYRLCEAVHHKMHRTIILCNNDDIKRAYELCNKECFDNYVPFWPMTHDAPRLLMSMHQAQQSLARERPAAPSAAQFAAQARQLAQLETLLDQQLTQGIHHIAGIEHEIQHLTPEEFTAPLRKVAEAIEPMKKWADDFRGKASPYLESTRALQEMAELVWPLIFIVDDDEFQQRVVGKLLEKENYRVSFAGSGVEALHLLSRIQPNLILMDIMMPDMDGIEITRRIKAMPQFSDVPIIMVTGKSEGAAVRDSIKAGAANFIVKPFNRETLLEKIAAALE